MAILETLVDAPANPQRRIRIRPALTATVADLENWLAIAAPGDAFAYYKGFLALDRSVGSRLGEHDRRELGRVADAMMTLARSGHVHLAQRRNDRDNFTYIAVASRSIRRRAARVSPSETAS